MGTIPGYDEVEKTLDDIFKMYDTDMRGELTPIQVQAIHEEIRMHGISLPQVLAAIGYVCSGDTADKSELFDLLQEMDRRYYLLQNLRWEFSMLDRTQTDTITEEEAKWLTQSVHGKAFSKKKWEAFIRNRPVPGSGVSFAELEVDLCNIPNRRDLQKDEEEELKEQEERLRRKRESEQALEEERERLLKKKEEERRRRQEEEDERLRKLKEQEDAKKKAEEDEEKKREREERERREKEEEELRKKEEEEAARKLKEYEEKKSREAKQAENAKKTADEAAEKERQAEEELRKAKAKLDNASDERAKKEAEELERQARQRQEEERNKRIRFTLKAAINARDREQLQSAVEDFEKAKLSDDDGDLAKGKKMLELFETRDGLINGMKRRNLKEIEDSMEKVKRKGFELDLAPEMLEAQKMVLQLRRLERIRAEILELKQSTVAEIRSYSSPPLAVHTVMIATFLLHGHTEKETKIWKNVQALVGKTGKDGLKRRCLEYDPDKMLMPTASRAKELLSKYGLDDVRDVSAGAATFYVWATSMIEEGEARYEQRKREAEEEARNPKPKSAKPAAGDTSKLTPAPAASRSRSKSPGRPAKNGTKKEIKHGNVKLTI